MTRLPRGPCPLEPPRQLSASIPGWWALAASLFKSPVEWLAIPSVRALVCPRRQCAHVVTVVTIP